MLSHSLRRPTRMRLPLLMQRSSSHGRRSWTPRVYPHRHPTLSLIASISSYLWFVHLGYSFAVCIIRYLQPLVCPSSPSRYRPLLFYFPSDIHMYIRSFLLSLGSILRLYIAYRNVSFVSDCCRRTPLLKFIHNDVS